MLIKKFRSAHSADVCALPFSNIFLTEDIHIKGLTCGDTVNTQTSNPILIVRRIDGESDKYALVSGFGGYCTALMRQFKEVNAIIVPDKSRKAFFESLRDLPEMVKVSSLKVPRGWMSPRPEKVDKCITHYNTFGTFGKDVIVDEHNQIIDGYAAVVAAQMLGVKKIGIMQVSRKEWTENHPKKKIQKPPWRTFGNSIQREQQ